MTKKELRNAEVYNPPGHHGMVALKLHDIDTSDAKTFWMGMSHFLPNGGADWAYEDSPTEKIYFVIDGEIIVKTKNETILLKKNDSLHIKPFEGREMINESNLTATVLVTISYPNKS